MALLILLLSFLIFLLFLFQKRRNAKMANFPPGPKGLPLIGNLHQLDKSNPQKYLWQLSQKYGPLMSLKIGLKPTLIISSAKMAEETLKTYDLECCSRPALTGQQKLSYNGLDLAFAPYDGYWREMRKICVVHLFSSNRVQSFRPIREDEVGKMIEEILKLVSACKPVNLTEKMMSLTSTIILRIAFGKKNEDGGHEKRRFQQLLGETQVMFGSFFLSDHLPYLGWIDKLTGLIARLEKTFREFDDFYQEIIDEHLHPDRSKPEQEDILDVLLQVWKDRSSKVEITLDHIKAILMDVFVAGTDTSAAAVIWAMSFLMKNPEVMNKVQKEIRNVIGNKGFVDEEDIPELSYLKAVVKEVLRLQPTVPLLIPRETTQKCHLGGYEIPAKTLVYINAWAIGRDPEAWENPKDFYPERFLSRNCNVDIKGQNYELIPFGAGRRICPGLHLGISTVEISLANLVYRFDWEMPPGLKREDIDMEEVLPGIAVHKRDHLCLLAKDHLSCINT